MSGMCSAGESTGTNCSSFPIPNICCLTAYSGWWEMSPGYKVRQVPGAGVGLVASRDLVPGELILSDSPTILSPPTRCRPQCLQCCKTLTNLGFVCNRCGFPLCGPTCQDGDLHRSDTTTHILSKNYFHTLSGLNVKCSNEQTLKQRLRISMWQMITMLQFFL